MTIFRLGLISLGVLVLIAVDNHSIAQQAEVAEEFNQEKFEDQQQRLEGTFQIQMIDTRSLPTFHISLYDKIEELRHESETTYYNVNANMRLKILPTLVIENEVFTPVERIVYISSK